jgi:dTDP-4-dehydrorhamnose 3,5-epimerase
MKLIDTPIAGLQLVEFASSSDARGSFERVYCRESLARLHPGFRVEQANLSRTLGRGALRGLHFQRAPSLEAKLVRCIAGSVFDVAVDLRAGSPTLLQWHAVRLDAAEPRAYFLPEGFAHGFQVLSDAATMLYFHSAAWDGSAEGGLRHDDPRLAIAWPLPVVQMSERDRSHPALDAGFDGLRA